MWSKVKTRFLSAIVLIILVLVALFFAPEWGCALIVSGVTYAVMYELTKAFDLKGKRALSAVNFIFATIFMALGYIDTKIAAKIIAPIIVFYVMLLSVISVLDSRKVKFSDVCSSVFLVFYSVAMLVHITFIRKLDNGILLLFMTLLGTYITDSGAYFTGMTIGKHKLIERVSPNKTIEGAIGGVLCSVIAFAVFGVVASKLGHSVNFLYLIILSVLCGVVAQLGDLSASVMKRSFQVKDFGNIIPGHGGILDRVDSLMFVAPVVYYFITFLPVIK